MVSILRVCFLRNEMIVVNKLFFPHRLGHLSGLSKLTRNGSVMNTETKSLERRVKACSKDKGIKFSESN